MPGTYLVLGTHARCLACLIKPALGWRALKGMCAMQGPPGYTLLQLDKLYPLFFCALGRTLMLFSPSPGSLLSLSDAS
jgi:hypothetical protein